MSIRTIIEINHDYLHDLLRHPEFWEELLRGLSGGDYNSGLFHDGIVRLKHGVTVLHTRHHSQTITLKVE